MKLLKENGFEGVAEAVTVLMNATMVAERSEYLGARLIWVEKVQKGCKSDCYARYSPCRGESAKRYFRL